MSKHLSVRVPDDLWDIVTQRAEREYRTVSSVVTLLLRTALGLRIEVSENAGRGVAAGWEQKKAATQQGKAAGSDQPRLGKERPAEASIEKQFREAAPRVIAQATEPEYPSIPIPPPKWAFNLPDMLRVDSDGDLVCDHRTGSVCEECEKQYAKEIREWQSAKR